MNATVLLLACSQAAVMTTISLVLSSSALVGMQLSSASLATVPLALQYLATMLLLYPAARLMERHGRRAIFGIGALIGALGLAIASLGVYLGNFWLFASAGLLIGVFNAVGQYYRFAAADAVMPDQRSSAISLTLSGGLLAAIAGPTLARLTKDALDTPFLASFIALTGVALLAALLARWLRLPPLSAEGGGGSPRRLKVIARDPRFGMALSGGVVGYATMNLLMTATPLAMTCSRLGFHQTAEVIQWHVVAMFAPSFFTGTWIRRIGPLPVMLAGCVLNLASIGVAQTGSELLHFEIALIFLGVGWNFLYVGATSLLTEVCRPEEKARLQALNDTLVFLAVTGATLLSGPLVDALGWQALNRYAALPVLAVAFVILRQMVVKPGEVAP